MAQSAQSNQRRASIIEIVGAWLHIWTPPRDRVIPPVPWRRLALWGAAGAVALGVLGAIFVPRIQESKAEKAAADRAFAERAAAANRARINALQAAHHGEAASLLPAAGASAAEVEQARAKMLSTVEASILADAKERAAKGQIRPVSGPASCTRAQGTPTAGPVRVYECYVVTVQIKATEKNLPGSLGYPFRAVVNYGTGAYTWCKSERPPGEKLVQWEKDTTHLPRECQGPKA